MISTSNTTNDPPMMMGVRMYQTNGGTAAAITKKDAAAVSHGHRLNQ